jgi:phenylalanyl-tRNA synthetase beta chain
MKLSIAWIFDHIDADWKKQDIDYLVAQFNKTTAEIEDFYRVAFDLKDFFIGTVKKSSATITLSVSELHKDFELAARTGTVDLIPEGISNPCFMIKKEGSEYRWATLADFGVGKDGFVPALDVSSDLLSGSWRDHFEDEDYIIEVDNKSVTHRPDMWGHRGFAREIAAYMHLPLKSKKHFCKELKTQIFEKESKPTEATPFAITNKAPQACSRFAGFYVSSVNNKPSSLLIASRLMKVGSRPINALIDLTNYVMQDWGQPVHAYDAQKVPNKNIVVRMAQDKEKLSLLDGSDLELTTNDLVITDDSRPLCLAGVMGGVGSGVDQTTTSIFFEAATFDAGYVRRTAQRHKNRTEASARFEKTLDPNQTIDVIQRFAWLLDVSGMKATYAPEVISVGKDVPTHIIEVPHVFLEQRMGVALTEDQVINLLSPLEFNVLKSFNERKEVIYLVTVPSFRSSKDVKIKEDILEEVVRCYGFERIPLVLPRIIRTPFDFSPVTRMNNIKRYFAYSAHMTEQQNYSLYDEQFLIQLGLTPETAVTLVNPVSENFARMITSLVPGLLKNIKANHVHQDKLSFFEAGRVWKKQNDVAVEQYSVAGIFFKKRSEVDFYQCKFDMANVFKTIGLNPDKIEWKKLSDQLDPWYRPYQTAALVYDKKIIGVAGKADSALLAKLDIGVECDAFVFELDGNFLISGHIPLPAYKPLSKFQDTYFDMSLFVPMTLETHTIEKQLHGMHELVTSVDLLDFFQKGDQSRALTFRVWIGNDEKTLEKADIDVVWKLAVSVVEKLGATVRM